MLKLKVLFVIFTTLSAAGLLLSHNATATVDESSLNGVLIDTATGLPLSGEIGLSFKIDGRLHLRHAFVGETGRFSVDGLPPTAISLVTKVENYASETATVPEGSGSTPVEFRLVRLINVNGRVRRDDGSALAGAVVKAISETSGSQENLAPSYDWQTGDSRTNESGEFSLTVSPHSLVVFEASHPEYLAKILPPRRVAPGEQIDITLNKGATISGSVVDSNSNPISGATVHLLGGAGHPSYPGFVSTELLKAQHKFLVTTADGRFTFENVTPTRRRLTVKKVGFSSVMRIIEIGSGAGNEPIQIVLD